MKIWKSIISQKLLWLLPLSFVFIFLIGASQTKATVNESFESFNDGQLNNQNNWHGTASSSIYVTSLFGESYHGNKSVISYNPDSLNYSFGTELHFATSSTGIQCLYAKLTGTVRTNEDNLFFLMIENYNGSGSIGFRINNNSNDLMAYYNSSWHDTGENIIRDEWSFYCIEWTTTQSRFTYLGTTTAWLTGGLSNASRITFQPEVEDDNVFRFDYLGSTTTQSYEDTVEIIEINPPDGVDFIPERFLTGECLTGPCVELENDFKYCYTDSPEECYIKYFINDWLSRNADYMYLGYATSSDLFDESSNIIFSTKRAFTILFIFSII